MTTAATIGRAFTGPADHRHIPQILDTITGISADPGRSVVRSVVPLRVLTPARRRWPPRTEAARRIAARMLDPPIARWAEVRVVPIAVEEVTNAPVAHRLHRR
jgi:hypothetical protein